jgi:ribosome-binding protein aMBF1 (putative translation factor)
MNLPSVSNAALPQNYEKAKAALAECASIDECKDWGDKAAALASYAKQAGDDTLQKYAERVRARAVRREGELWKQLDGRPNNAKKQNDASGNLISQKDMANHLGVSERHVRTAKNIASIPQQDFERQVESDKPPTLSQLAQQGIKPRENIVDLHGRDPKEYNRALHYVADFEEAAKELEAQKHDLILPTLDEKERARLRAAIQRIDAITDKVATRI